MEGENFARSCRKRRMGIWLELVSGYLRDSDSEFLRSFSDYLEEGYKGQEQADYAFKEPSWSTKQQFLLKKMLDFEAFRLTPMQTKGCALIGKTDFDKLEFIKAYFKVLGLSEFAGNETEFRYAVVGCSGIKGYGDLIKSLVKNQDTAYVIFDNCDSLLKHDEALIAFKQLSEDYSGLTLITKNKETINFKTDSFFVFLGEENTLHIAVEKQIRKGLGASAYNHLDAFIHYIHVYDFDKGERYYGYNVSPIYA